MTALSGEARAGLLGVGAGLRTFSPLAALSLRGQSFAGWSGRLLTLAAAGELIFDKLPQSPSRLSHSGRAARAISAGWAGATVARVPGMALGVGAAMTSAYAGYHGRRILRQRTGWPDAACAVVEDWVAVLVVSIATS